MVKKNIFIKIIEILNVGFGGFYRLTSRKVLTYATSISSLFIGLLIFDISTDKDDSERVHIAFFIGALSLILIFFLIDKYYVGDAFKKVKMRIRKNKKAVEMKIEDNGTTLSAMH